MEKCRHGREFCKDCVADAYEEKAGDLKAMIVRLDSYLTLVRHRYQGKALPDDLIREIDQAISEAREIVK